MRTASDIRSPSALLQATAYPYVMAHKMRISFDIDDTLIPYGNSFDTEEQPLIAKLLGAEKIRAGANMLLKAVSRNHEL